MTRRRIAWIVLFVVAAGYVAWGAGVAVAPDRVLGPGGRAILPAGYEGYSGGSWSQLSSAAPASAGYMTVLYRMYGMYCALFGLLSGVVIVTAFRRGERWAWWMLLAGNSIALLSAITYDRVVHAIGPFELTEYLGLVLVWGALAATAPFRPARPPVPAVG